MNFFESQDIARRNSNRLVWLFIIAIVLLTLSSYVVTFLAVYGIFFYIGSIDTVSNPLWWWNGKIFIGSTSITLLLIGGGSLYKMRQLSSGGRIVAESLGGKRVLSSTTDPDEQRLLNVVEEMAIASGTAVPPVFLLNDESCINAFAAGHTINDAAIGVTKGCLQQLSRDELQGVIAHEFSHILNGDMKMNTELVGMLHGIYIIFVTGRVIFNIAVRSGGGRSSRKNNSPIQLAVVGIGIMILGSMGLLAGRLIKSAISRQREYLADAAAVQFTRNPDGIANALKKVGGFTGGAAAMRSAQAEEYSHLMFSRVKGWRHNAWMSTHPPLEQRIKRIDPQFNGDYPKPRLIKSDETSKISPWFSQLTSGIQSSGANVAGFAETSGATVGASAANVVENIGNTSSQHLAYAQYLLAALPESLGKAAHDMVGASAIVYALLLDDDMKVMREQLRIVDASGMPGVAQEAYTLARDIRSLDKVLWIPLAELCVGALREMSHEQYEKFVRIMLSLVQADNSITLFEFVLQKVIRHRLRGAFESTTARVARFHAITPLMPDLNLLLSMLAHLGHEKESQAQQAFNSGFNAIAPYAQKQSTFMAAGECSFAKLDIALDKMESAALPVKEQIVNACVHCVLCDGVVTANEAELLRAICDILDCPIPPFVFESKNTNSTTQSSPQITKAQV